MIIEQTTFLPCSPQQCFEEVKTSHLMLHVASPMVKFIPIQPSSLPERWEQKVYVVSLRLFGFLPIGKQWINISGRKRSKEMGRFYVEFRDNGRGTLISTWDHLITIQAPKQGNGTIYTDRVEIKAGILTPFVCLFAWLFYRHRQKRWQRLVANRFSYND